MATEAQGCDTDSDYAQENPFEPAAESKQCLKRLLQGSLSVVRLWLSWRSSLKRRRHSFTYAAFYHVFIMTTTCPQSPWTHDCLNQDFLHQ